MGFHLCEHFWVIFAFLDFRVELGFQGRFLTFKPGSRLLGHPTGGRINPDHVSDRSSGRRAGIFDHQTARDLPHRSMASSSNDPDSLVTLLMGTKVGLVLKILCKFQMGQLQDQEPRRSRKQCKDWCNPLGMKLARAQQSKVCVGLLEALASFWDPTHCCFLHSGRWILFPTLEEYAGLLQLDSPFSETPVIPIQGPRSNRGLEKYLGLASAVFRPEIIRPEETWRKSQHFFGSVGRRYFSRSDFPVELARDFIAGKRGWKKVPNQCLQDRLCRAGLSSPAYCARPCGLCLSAGDRERGSRCSALSSFSFGSAVTCSISTASRPLIHFERYTVKQTVKIALPFTGNSRDWALYLLDLPLGYYPSLALRQFGGVQYPPRLGDLDAVTFDYIPSEDMWRLLSRIEDIWGGLQYGQVHCILWCLALFGFQLPTGQSERVIVLERELEEAQAELASLRLARASEREESAARVESMRSTLHHNSAAVANLRRDLEVQRGNVSTLRTMNDFIREQLEISEAAKDHIEETLTETQGQLWLILPQVVLMTLWLSGGALDEGEAALTSARTSMGAMRVPDQRSPGARAVLEEHDEGDPALSTALGRFCRETCIRLGH
uniref:Aminotransferase-like plant mobile domain-containing protein n=1 Tax=Fagus sylvatica TaxID=28930 RepID=A0A2N9FY72_FAGSY